MNLILFLYDRLCWSMCRHEWVRERESGKLVERCAKCMKVQPDRMTVILRSRPDYEPIEPAYPSEMPAPLQSPRKLKRAA